MLFDTCRWISRDQAVKPAWNTKRSNRFACTGFGHLFVRSFFALYGVSLYTIPVCHICLHLGGLGGQCRHLFQSQVFGIYGVYSFGVPHPCLHPHVSRHSFSQLCGPWSTVTRRFTGLSSTNARETAELGSNQLDRYGII